MIGQPLTKKAKAAIVAYVQIQEVYSMAMVVHCAVKAERMRRDDLYAYLERYGWRWYPRHGIWKFSPRAVRAK